MRTTCLIIIGLAFSALSSAQDWNRKIDLYLQAQMDTFHIPAVSAAIVENGVVKYKRTFGMAVPEFKIKNTDTTAFQLASATKLISATAIMTLVQEKKLNLQAGIREYLPELPASWQDMKVIDLLSHQSGVADLLALQYNFTSLKQALDTAISRPLDFAPGTKTVYAGGDYAVIMSLIERISGTDYQTFLRKSLLDRLQMNHTAYNNMSQDYIYRTYDILPFAATVYSWDEKAEKQRIFSMMFPSWSYPSGGLFASVSDLVKWVIALDNNTLLQPEIQEQMWTATKLRNGQTAPFGVGWIVDKYQDEKATGHSGGPALADIVRLPERKLTVIILTNQLNLRPFLAMKVMKMYLETNETHNH